MQEYMINKNHILVNFRDAIKHFHKYQILLGTRESIRGKSHSLVNIAIKNLLVEVI